MMMAQSVFDTYKSNERVTYVSVVHNVFRCLPNSTSMIQTLKQRSFRVDFSNQCANSFEPMEPQYLITFPTGHKSIKTNQLSELMQVREDQTIVYFFAALSEKENIVNQLVMLAQEDNDNAALDDRNQTVLLYIDGKIDLARIASLVQKLDIPAGEELNKLKGQVKT